MNSDDKNYIPTEDSNLVRDPRTRALFPKSPAAANAYRKRRNIERSREEEIDSLRSQVKELQQQMQLLINPTTAS